MKTLDDIKQLRAHEMEYVNWEEFIYSIDDPDIVDGEVDNVAKMYALEVAKEALKNSNFRFEKHYYLDNVDMPFEKHKIRELITDEENIPKEVKL